VMWTARGEGRAGAIERDGSIARDATSTSTTTTTTTRCGGLKILERIVRARGGDARSRGVETPWDRSIDRSIAPAYPPRRDDEDRRRADAFRSTTTDPNASIVAYIQGVKAAPAQRATGYKGSTESGSAPKTYVRSATRGRARISGVIYPSAERTSARNDGGDDWEEERARVIVLTMIGRG
jgi:hypothetical protein